MLPVASALGISFDEVGAAMAAMTRTGSNAATAGTQLNAVMSGLLKPTPQAEDALKSVGLTSQQLRDTMAQPGGLITALGMLKDNFGDNEAAMAKVFPNVRALRGVLDLLGANVATTEDIFDSMSNTVNLTGEAFGTMADTDAFRAKQAWADLQVAAIELGVVLMPLARDLIAMISKLANTFAGLPDPMQKTLVIVGGLAAAIGPLVWIVGSLIKTVGALKIAMAATSLTGAGMIAMLSKIAVVAGIAGAAFGATKAITAGLRGEVGYLHRDVSLLEKPFQMAGKFGYWLGGGAGSAADNMARAEEEANRLWSSMTSGVYTMDQLTERLNENNVAGEERALIVVRFQELLDQQAEAEANLAEKIAEDEAATRAAAAAEAERGGMLDFLSEAIDETRAALENRAHAEETAAEITAAAEAAIEAHTEALREEASALQEAADALNARVTAHRSAADATFALRDAEDSYTGTLERSVGVLNDSSKSEREHRQAMDDIASAAGSVADAHIRVAEQTAAMSGETRSATRRLDILNESLLEQAAAAEGEARTAILDYITAINDIPDERATYIATLIDEGRFDAAMAVLESASATRDTTIMADANTDAAETRLATVARPRTVSITPIVSQPSGPGNGLVRALDGGGMGRAGDIVAEFGPEFVGGKLVTMPSVLTRSAPVVGREETARRLLRRAGNSLTSVPYASTMGRSSVRNGDVKVRVFIGDTELTDIVRTEIDGYDDDGAEVLAGGMR